MNDKKKQDIQERRARYRQRQAELTAEMDANKKTVMEVFEHEIGLHAVVAQIEWGDGPFSGIRELEVRLLAGDVCIQRMLPIREPDLNTERIRWFAKVVLDNLYSFVSENGLYAR